MAKPHIMYIEGPELLTPEVESLAVLPVEDVGDETGQ